MRPAGQEPAGPWRTPSPTGFTRSPTARGDIALLKKLLIIGLIAGIALAYIGPVRDYLAQKDQLHAQQVALIKARQVRDGLAVKISALKDPQVLEARARELGMVRPGETPYAVRGIKHPSPPPTSGGQGESGVWGFISGFLG